MSEPSGSSVRSIVIIGAGGHAREIAGAVSELGARGAPVRLLGYVVDPAFAKAGDLVAGHPVLGGFDWLSRHAAEVQVICGVGQPESRRRLVARARELGVAFASIVHPSSQLGATVELGVGVLVGAGSILTQDVKLGDHAHVNVGCSISHDCALAPFATLAPGVRLAGGVRIGEGAALGIGANVAPRLSVGEWSIVGAGGTVVRDVPANSTVVGVPCRVIRTREPGWHEDR